MVFNHCLYGSINKTDGKLVITYYPNDLSTAVKEELIITEDSYQFNLGNASLLGINANIYENDIVILEYFDVSGTKLFSDYVKLEKAGLQEYPITVSNLTETTDAANFVITESVIKTTSNNVQEDSLDMYSYFEVYNVDTNTLLYSSNDNLIKFAPVTSNKYKVKQRAVNKTSNVLTEKEYEFNAIVSSATITRSNKCKGINDSIKILFMGYDENPTNITVIKDDSEIESGTMAVEGNNLFSYNYVFPSTGYFCFVIEYYDETFLIDFKVEQSDFKIYYSEENHTTGLSLPYNLYFINDVNTVIDTGNLIEVGNGIYSSDLLSVEYGDYMFEIQNDFHVSSFEECASSSGSDTSLSNSSEEEVFWIFPNIIGD